MKINVFITSVVILFQQSLMAQNYIWPTNAGHYLSSSFGEYRDGHFHSGIDIKTNYRTGYPVFAIADGYVWRIRSSPFGYGKAIYLKLDDGNYAVYGHLDDFARTLNARVKTEQTNSRRYQTDIYFHENEYRVSQGDTIAYTGETGTKHPHLHFEIRDENNRVINPLNTNLTITDYTIPTIKAIAVVPLAPAARVNGLPLYRVFPANYIHKKLFAIGDTVVVVGKVGIEIKTHDTVRGLPNHYNPYGIRMTVDDSLFFQVQYDSFDFAESHFINTDRDYQLFKNGFGHFHRLWFEDYSKDLRFYSQSPGNGLLQLPPGKHQVKIEVYDRYMNTSTVNFTVYGDTSFRSSIEKIKRTEKGWSLTVNTEEPESTNVFAKIVNSAGVFKSPVPLDTFIQNSAEIRVAFSETQRNPGDIYAITLRKKSSRQPESFFINPDIKSTKLGSSPETVFIHSPHAFLSKIIFDQAPNTTPTFFMQTSSDIVTIPVYALSPTEYISGSPSLNSLKSCIAFEWRYNKLPENIVRIPVDFTTLTPGEMHLKISGDSSLFVQFPVNSVYDTLICWINQRVVQDNCPDPIVSKIYTLNPADQPLRSDIELQVNLPPGIDHPEQLGIYQMDGDTWEFLGNQWSPDRSALKAGSDKLGSIAVLRDSAPPNISAVFPGNGGRFHAGDIIYLSAIVKDDLSGIKDDTSIAVTLDGRPLIAEYNAPKDHVRYKISGNLAPGAHLLRITATDQANNTSTESSTFSVY